MGESNRNSAGFGAIEIVLLLVIVGMIGFLGWFVLQARSDTTPNNVTLSPNIKTDTADSTKAAPEPKETDSWYLYKRDGLYQIRLADGLNFTTPGLTDSGELVYTRNLETKAGVTATVHQNESGSDNPYGFFIFYRADKADAVFQGDEKTGFKTDSGLTVKKYLHTQTTPPQGIGIAQDDQSYTYVIEKNNEAIEVVFAVDIAQSRPVQTDVQLIEKMIKTADLL